LTGFTFNAFNEACTPCFLSSVFNSATWLVVFAITNPPRFIPNRRAPPAAPVYLRKSLLLNPLIDLTSVRIFVFMSPPA
jgi:hypothetical protein